MIGHLVREVARAKLAESDEGLTRFIRLRRSAARVKAESAPPAKAHPLAQQLYLPPPGSIARSLLGCVVGGR